MAQQPVFYDPRQARWKRLRRIFDLAALAFTFLVIFFIYTALRSERLPDLLLPIQKRPYHALKEKEKDKAKEHRRLAALHRGHRKSKAAPSQVKLNAEEGIALRFTFPGTQPASPRCVNTRARSTCFFQHGCRCLRRMAGCNPSMSKPTSCSM